MDSIDYNVDEYNSKDHFTLNKRPSTYVWSRAGYSVISCLLSPAGTNSWPHSSVTQQLIAIFVLAKKNRGMLEGAVDPQRLWNENFWHNSKNWKRPTNCELSRLLDFPSPEMHQNHIFPEFRPPGPHWASLQRSPRHFCWWGGGLLSLPKNPTPCSLSSLLASDFSFARVCFEVVSQTRPPNHWIKWCLYMVINITVNMKI